MGLKMTIRNEQNARGFH